MPVSARYLLALAIQALGPLALLALSIAISQSKGSQVQGVFASTKAWVDLVVAVGLMGLPQSIVLAVNRGRTSRAALFHFAWRYAALVFAAAMAGCLAWATWTGATAAPWTLLVVAAATAILAGLWRGILLTVDDGVRFNFVTVMPTLLLVALAAVALVALPDFDAALPALFALAGAASLAGSFALSRAPILRPPASGERPDYRSLFVNGLDVFAQTVCASLQVFACYWMLNRVGGAQAAGQMSIALLILNAFNFPLQSVSPMLLNRWSKQRGADSLTDGRRELKWLALAFLALSSVAIAVAMVAAPLLFKPQDRPDPLMWLLLLSVVPALLSRTAALRLAAQGQFRFNSKIAMLQALLFVAAFAALAALHWLPPTVAAALAWVAADGIVACLFTRRLRAVRADFVPY